MIKKIYKGEIMKKIIAIVSLLFTLFTLSACSLFDDGKPKYNEVSKEYIDFTSISRGKVIDEGKVAIFLKFKSDYNLNKIEAVGALVNASGENVVEFEESMNYSPARKSVEIVVMVDADLLSEIRTATFTLVKGYTLDEIAVE